LARSSWRPSPAGPAWFNEGVGGGRAPLACFAVSFLFLLITHFPYLRLPYHWDELGYYVPAAREILVSGNVVPRGTPPTVHPPLLLLYLAAAWKLFGFGIPVTRVAMLVVGAATLSAVFVLAGRLAGARAAATAVVLLAVSPPFVTQTMLAHLDLAAAFWTLITLICFVQGRWALCGAAAAALVLTKETGLIIPAALAAFAGGARKRLWILAPPVAALGCWLLQLQSVTGHWLGNPEFARYNLKEALDLARIPLALARRLYQLGFANFHWIATGALIVAGLRRRAPAASLWRPLGACVAGLVALHSVTGGALLLRYLLPALALFYVAAAAAFETLTARMRRAALVVLLAGLAVSNWWNPPYPFAWEDNLALVDFVRLQQRAALWLSEQMPERTVTTAWPMTDALTNPLAGYLQKPLRVRPIENFQSESWATAEAGGLDVVALYSRSWEPEPGWQRWPPAARLLERRFGWRPQRGPQELICRNGMRRVARWESRGQWMEILVASTPAGSRGPGPGSR